MYNSGRKKRRELSKKVKELKRALKGKISFENLEEYVNTFGYKIIFFNTFDGDIEVKRYNKEEIAKDTDAFTHCGTAQIIFINYDVSSESKIYLLLHEIGHIVLGHIGDGKLFLRNKILIDIEADTFAYLMLF